MEANKKVWNELYSLERQKKNYIRVLPLQNKASKLGIIFWDTQYMNNLSNLSIDFTVSKGRAKVKYGYR